MNTIRNIDCLVGLRQLADESVDCCVTSPPYFGLRDYGHDGQIGMEETPEAYVAKMVEVFTEVKRVLKKDGTLWLNLGDSYYNYRPGGTSQVKQSFAKHHGAVVQTTSKRNKVFDGIKEKDLIGIPWMVAFALRADGWYLRQDIIWAKKNCMPESVTDRCTKSHEYIFMLSKNKHYYYDQDAIKEPALYDVDGTGTQARKARQKEGAKSEPTGERAGIRKAGMKDATAMNGKHKQDGHRQRHAGFNERYEDVGMRNKRDVWTISPAQFPESHFATFPEEIPAICIKAGCPIDGLVLDPFMGAGTTALVARKLNRNFIGFELNLEYCQMALKRIDRELGMFK